ncbi:MAG: fasciclin domain-containing protein, partial [Anaerolineales bacterium]
MKKGTKFSLFSLLLIAGLVLAACGGSATVPAATEATEPEATEVPAETSVEPTAEPEMAEEEAEPTVVDIAASNEDFSTLVAAVEAAGLAETLSSEGPFTVFAPTNAAFEAALADLGLTAEELLADTELLTQVLTYHVVPGDLMAADVLEQNLLETVEGSFALAYSTEEGAFINQASIVQADIEASNGVVHVIDSVILPPSYQSEASASIVEVASSDEQFSTLVTAVSEAGLAETLAERGPFTVFAPTNEAFNAALEALGIT